MNFGLKALFNKRKYRIYLSIDFGLLLMGLFMIFISVYKPICGNALNEMRLSIGAVCLSLWFFLFPLIDRENKDKALLTFGYHTLITSIIAILLGIEINYIMNHLEVGTVVFDIMFAIGGPFSQLCTIWTNFKICGTNHTHLMENPRMKHELNSQSTKQLLADALVQLTEKKPFSKITVSEIVTLCDINRKTFYYHFTDVYDLLEWYLNGEIEKAVQSFDSVYDFDSTITYASEYMNHHPYLARFVEDSLGREKITQILTKVISPLTDDIIQKIEITNHKDFEPDFKEFLVKNFTRIIVLSILDNIENPENYDIEKMKRYISSIFEMSLLGEF